MATTGMRVEAASVAVVPLVVWRMFAASQQAVDVPRLRAVVPSPLAAVKKLRAVVPNPLAAVKKLRAAAQNLLAAVKRLPVAARNQSVVVLRHLVAVLNLPVDAQPLSVVDHLSWPEDVVYYNV